MASLSQACIHGNTRDPLRSISPREMRISRLILCISTHIGLLLSAVCPSCVVLGAFLCPTLPFPFCAEWAPDPCRVAGLPPFGCSLSARSFSSLSRPNVPGGRSGPTVQDIRASLVTEARLSVLSGSGSLSLSLLVFFPLHERGQVRPRSIREVNILPYNDRLITDEAVRTQHIINVRQSEAV